MPAQQRVDERGLPNARGAFDDQTFERCHVLVRFQLWKNSYASLVRCGREARNGALLADRP
jgi:hypothetical protein